MPDLFLHNPRCSKSRAALDIARQAGIELPVRARIIADVAAMRRVGRDSGRRSPASFARPMDSRFGWWGRTVAMSLDAQPHQPVSSRQSRALL